LKTAAPLVCLLALTGVSAESGFAQRTEPAGPHLAIGMTALNGIGLGIGYVNAGDFLTRELAIQSDLRSMVNPGETTNQVFFSFGGAIRIFGFERTIGNVGYRGYDLDAGIRVGPAFSFSTRETLDDRNRRINLFVEPFFRISARTGFVRALFLEAGTTRPHLRLGMWLWIG